MVTAADRAGVIQTLYLHRNQTAFADKTEGRLLVLRPGGCPSTAPAGKGQTPQQDEPNHSQANKLLHPYLTSFLITTFSYPWGNL